MSMYLIFFACIVEKKVLCPGVYLLMSGVSFNSVWIPSIIKNRSQKLLEKQHKKELKTCLAVKTLYLFFP